MLIKVSVWGEYYNYMDMLELIRLYTLTTNTKKQRKNAVFLITNLT